MNLTHIESRPSRSSRGDYDFIVNLNTLDRANYDAALADVQALCKTITTLARQVDESDSSEGAACRLIPQCLSILVIYTYMNTPAALDVRWTCANLQCRGTRRRSAIWTATRAAFSPSAPSSTPTTRASRTPRIASAAKWSPTSPSNTASASPSTVYEHYHFCLIKNAWAPKKNFSHTLQLTTISCWIVFSTHVRIQYSYK